MTVAGGFRSPRSASRKTSSPFDIRTRLVDNRQASINQEVETMTHPSAIKINFLQAPELGGIWMPTGELVSGLLRYSYGSREEENWRDIGTSRVRASEAASDSLKHFYDLRNPEEVVGFIDKNSHLVFWLVLMRARIRKHFPGSQPYLEVISDPEVDDVRLVVFVKVDCEPNEAIERLDEFDAEWSSMTPSQADQNLTVTVEF